MTLDIKLGVTENPRTRPVIDGRATPESIKLATTVLHPSELFFRQLHHAEFDAAEMSMSSLMMMLSRGDQRFIGLPVFTMRHFFHTHILVRRDSGIRRPADLKGKRVGVPEYQQTGALWIRGVLQHEFGVLPQDIEFWMERTPSQSHASAVGFKPPPGVTINQIPPNKGIGSMMVAGELDASMYYIRASNMVDRSTEDLEGHPEIRPLFEDEAAECVRYYRKSGIYPINHGMVIKRDLAAQHPWIVNSLLKAFVDANDIADRERMEHVAYHLETGTVPAQYRQALATPLLKHGIAANRHILETAATYSHEQGLTPRLLSLDEIFAPGSLGS
jgi:4,5-dihydroxyphthalate decarboxylase